MSCSANSGTEAVVETFAFNPFLNCFTSESQGPVLSPAVPLTVPARD